MVTVRGLIVVAGIVGYLLGRYVWRRKLNRVLSEFRRATNKPALTWEELLSDVKTLKTPIRR